MIIFKKLRYKNFLSSGDKFTEIDFLLNSTNLIVGTNGAGKSTILDALCFVLFNKAFRKINKPQLVNSINNKDCVVEIEFSVGSRNYMVRRGIKPNVFDIEVDGKMLDKRSDDRDNQQLLEENILKVNYKSFTQIVILGSAGFTPFMQLNASNRREVIEDLLDIRVFSSMSTIVKDKIRELREDLKVLKMKKDSLADKVIMQKNFIDEIVKRGETRIEEKQDEAKGLLFEQLELQKEINAKLEEVEALDKQLQEFDGASDKLKKLSKFEATIKEKIAAFTKNHKFFTENEICPTCTQDIAPELKESKLSEMKEEKTKLKKGFEELQEAIAAEEERESAFKTLSKKITEANREVSTGNVKVSSYNKQIASIEADVESIKNSIENQPEEQEKLRLFEEGLVSTNNKIADRNTEMEKHQFIFELLKDGGVKTNIIRKYLPLINQQVNRYLQLMEFYINFNLDEEFNETIQSPIHENFSYSSFSEGEKMRVDLALLFTWREVARVRNSVNTNLLIMDEVFDSSLDGFGTEEFLKIIRYVVQDANIFIISHKQELHERFESVLKFEKDRGFSKLVSK